jgi:uncharacterized protein
VNTIVKNILTILLLLPFMSNAQTLESADECCADFKIGETIVSRGGTYQGALTIPKGEHGIETLIPITVHHGTNAGPVLSLIAGIHGSEYSPILAMQKFAKLIDPNSLNGTVIVVHIANIPAFSARTILVRMT